MVMLNTVQFSLKFNILLHYMTTFFFGAGASMCLGLPDMAGLKREMNDRCTSIIHKSILELYADQNLEELCRDVQQALDTKHNKIINNMLHTKSRISGTELYEKLTELQTILREILLDKLEPSDDLEQYTKMLNQIGIGVKQCDIITTNYDLIIDRCLKQNMVDGFVNDDNKENIKVWEDDWKLIENGTRVIKLHGSINWQNHKDKNYRISKSGNQVRYVEKLPVPGHRGTDRDVMLLPALNSKDYDKHPFNALYDQFVKIIDNTDLLVSIGYSFKDERINNEIKKRIEKGLTLLAIMPKAWQKTINVFQDGKYMDNNPTQILVCNGTPYAQSDHTNYNLFVYEVKFEQHTADNIGIIIETVRAHIDGQQIEFKPLNKKERKRHNCQPVD